jgi:hypothetical protein
VRSQEHMTKQQEVEAEFDKLFSQPIQPAEVSPVAVAIVRQYLTDDKFAATINHALASTYRK